MDNLETLGRWIVIGGVLLVVMGGLLWLLGRATGISHLPGTIRIQTGGLTCLIPILGSIILSVVLTIVLNLLARFLNR